MQEYVAKMGNTDSLEVGAEYEFFDGSTPSRHERDALSASVHIPDRGQAAQCDRRDTRLRQACGRNRRWPFRRRATAGQNSFGRQRLAVFAQTARER